MSNSQKIKPIALSIAKLYMAEAHISFSQRKGLGWVTLKIVLGLAMPNQHCQAVMKEIIMRLCWKAFKN